MDMKRPIVAAVIVRWWGGYWFGRFKKWRLCEGRRTNIENLIIIICKNKQIIPNYVIVPHYVPGFLVCNGSSKFHPGGPSLILHFYWAPKHKRLILSILLLSILHGTFNYLPSFSRVSKDCINSFLSHTFSPQKCCRRTTTLQTCTITPIVTPPPPPLPPRLKYS